MKTRVALENRLKNSRHVITLGVRPNLCDYEAWQRDLIRKADTVYYPTGFYADLLDTMGKSIFPNYHTYKFTQDKIKQTALFNLLGINHPNTRVFYGNRQKKKILQYFTFPFIGKTPRGSALGKGVYLIKNEQDLFQYLRNKGPAYIQDYIPMKKDLRVVVVQGRALHAYWRVATGDDFRTNVSQGGKISFDQIPEAGVAFAVQVAKQCRIDDAGFDIYMEGDAFGILEMNMKYGKEGFLAAGMDYDALIDEMLENDEI